jgi:Holliday junction resolvasome RuvABC ATP-dependent DNA helicase subunit
MTRRNIASFYDEQGVDPNGLDSLALSFLRYLKQQGTTSEPTRRQALGLAHPQDFVETAEYLVRLGLIETSTAGRRLTRQGERYLKSDLPPDLRERISRTRQGVVSGALGRTRLPPGVRIKVAFPGK